MYAETHLEDLQECVHDLYHLHVIKARAFARNVNYSITKTGPTLC